MSNIIERKKTAVPVVRAKLTAEGKYKLLYFGHRAILAARKAAEMAAQSQRTAKTV